MRQSLKLSTSPVMVAPRLFRLIRVEELNVARGDFQGFDFQIGRLDAHFERIIPETIAQGNELQGMTPSSQLKLSSAFDLRFSTKESDFPDRKMSFALGPGKGRQCAEEEKQPGGH